MNNNFLVFIGAGIGGVLRYWVTNGINNLFGKQFPFGTLIVNVSGCFMMGLLFIFLFEKVDNISPFRALLLIGLLGGYTTFSSFSIETITLIETGKWASGVINILISLTACLAATWAGIFFGKILLGRSLLNPISITI